jgi:O-antigen/teichoic acid export membrane protein
MQLMGRVLMVLGGVEPLILFLWLMRRACYVVLKPVWAASGGSVYVVLLLGGTYGLNRIEYLSAETGLILMGLTSLVAGAWIWNLLRRSGRAQDDFDLKPEVRHQHWTYGRWATTTGALQWVPGQLAYLILPVAIGLEAGGALKALLNFIMPVAHIYGSLAVLLVPIFVRVRKSNHFHQVFGGSLLVVFLGTGLYWVLLGWWGEPFMALLYNGHYTEYAHLLWLVGSLPVMAGLGSVLRTVLRALERPDQVFWAYLGSSIVASTLGVYLIFSFGLEGALFSFIAQMVVELSVMFYFFFRGESRIPAVVLRPEGITE